MAGGCLTGGVAVSAAGHPGSRCLPLPILAGSPSPHFPVFSGLCPKSAWRLLGNLTKSSPAAPAPAPRAAGCQEGGGEPRGPEDRFWSESMSFSALGTELDRDRPATAVTCVLQGTQGQHHRKDEKGKGLNQPTPPTPRPKVR